MLLLLFLSPVDDNRGPDHSHRQPADEDVRGRPHARGLQVVDELLHDGHARAAVLLGPSRGHPSLLSHLLAPGEDVAQLLEQADTTAAQLWRALLLNEIVDFSAKRLFLSGEAKVHAKAPFGRSAIQQ